MFCLKVGVISTGAGQLHRPAEWRNLLYPKTSTDLHGTTNSTPGAQFLLLGRTPGDIVILSKAKDLLLTTALHLTQTDILASITFVAADRKLLQAARAEGLRTLNPELPT